MNGWTWKNITATDILSQNWFEWSRLIWLRIQIKCVWFQRWRGLDTQGIMKLVYTLAGLATVLATHRIVKEKIQEYIFERISLSKSHIFYNFISQAIKPSSLVAKMSDNFKALLKIELSKNIPTWSDNFDKNETFLMIFLKILPGKSTSTNTPRLLLVAKFKLKDSGKTVDNALLSNARVIEGWNIFLKTTTQNLKVFYQPFFTCPDNADLRLSQRSWSLPQNSPTFSLQGWPLSPQASQKSTNTLKFYQEKASKLKLSTKWMEPT